MKFYNIKNYNEQVTFSQALIQGFGSNQGLLLPTYLPKFSVFEIKDLLKMNFKERSIRILSDYVDDDLSASQLFSCVDNAFNFPIPVVLLHNNIAILELFHGPTLAFKDFGSRLMAQMLHQIQRSSKRPMVILTATSGDTGAAVAHAFYGLSNIYVVILYPKNKISKLQEKLFCTLGNNIFTISVNGDFDVCQSLIKKAFNDTQLRKIFDLNSANSINISRVLGQMCYYFELVSQLTNYTDDELVISVPSGNFGNLTAGLLAQFSGLPVKKFIIATNCNNTVPRFLESGTWHPYPTISTISNAMDVSCPNNWPRIEELFYKDNRSIKELGYGYVDDVATRHTVEEMSELGYISDPHTAVAYRVLHDQLHPNEFGVCLGTAHPIKFKELVESFLKKRNVHILFPNSLKKYVKLPILSYEISDCFVSLRNLILKLLT